MRNILSYLSISLSQHKLKKCFKCMLLIFICAYVSFFLFFQDSNHLIFLNPAPASLCSSQNQPSTNAQNQVPTLCFFFFNNPIHSDVHHRMEDLSLFAFHWLSGVITFTKSSLFKRKSMPLGVQKNLPLHNWKKISPWKWLLCELCFTHLRYWK